MPDLPTAEIPGRVEAAAQRRVDAGVTEVADSYRLVHGRWDALPGLRVERLADWAVVRYRDPSWADDATATALVDGLRRAGVLGATWIYDASAKDRTPASNARDEALEARMGALDFRSPEDTILGHEYDRTFALSSRSGFSCGLFFDMRECRHDLAQRWHGKSVLNLFSYTCGFGVVLAGNNDVTNVDTSAPALDWGRQSYALNDLPVEDGAFVKKDAFSYLEIAAKVGNRFDAVILDPPSYSAGKRGKRSKARRFSLRDDLGELVALALDVLEPDGELFASTNLESLDRETFAAIVERQAGLRGKRIRRRWSPAGDFPVPDDAYHLKTALVA